jgi:hypothetical protein
MMGPRQVEQAALFYSFSLESHVPQDHMLRAIDRFVALGDLRRQLAPFYSETGRPSIDPELMICRVPNNAEQGLQSRLANGFGMTEQSERGHNLLSRSIWRSGYEGLERCEAIIGVFLECFQ